jgi:hypothetical protein
VPRKKYPFEPLPGAPRYHPAGGAGMHTRTRLNLRLAESPMIAKTFVIAKDFRTYATIFLRQEKILHDHGDKRIAAT